MSQIFKLDRKALAKELGISDAYLSMIINGKRKPLKYQKRIRDILKRASDQLKKVA